MAAPVAAVQFTQGATVGTAGQALFGVAGTAVVAANGNNTNVNRWTFTIIDVPPGSAVPIGVVQDGASPTYTFTPDLSGGYHVQITVTAADGTGVQVVDDRVFGVKRPSGLFIPPFKATDSALNFGGQTRGWSPYMEAWLYAIEGNNATGVIPRKTANYTVQNTDPDTFGADTSAGSFALTFPSAPHDGQKVTFRDNHSGGSWQTHALSLTGNTGQKVENPNALGTWSAAAGTVQATTPGALTYQWWATEAVWLLV